MKQASLLFLFTVFFINISVMAIEQNEDSQKWKLGFSERFRLVTWDNAITLDDDAQGSYTFTRHRTSIMAQWYPCDQFETAVKLTNEFRYYFSPEDKEFDWNEIFIDQLYFKWKDPFNIKGSITLGRQNLILGEGFVVMDGGPLVGSRSIYFNAARFDWRIKKDKELTLFYLYQPKIDEFLPIINDQNAPLIEQPENGFGLYFKTIREDLDFDVYYIRKNIKRTAVNTSKSERNTIGLRFDDDKWENTPINFKLEGAYQFGKSDDNDISAAGGYLVFSYKANWEQEFLPKNISTGIVYLGEGWDPLFSRWPKWSESYIYTQIKENRVAYWSNLFAFTSGINFTPSSNTKLSIDYLHMMAIRTHDFREPLITGNSSTRGNLLIGKLDFKINKNLTGHLLWESFIPGNFYCSCADNYNWARFELMYKI